MGVCPWCLTWSARGSGVVETRDAIRGLHALAHSNAEPLGRNLDLNNLYYLHKLTLPLPLHSHFDSNQPRSAAAAPTLCQGLRDLFHSGAIDATIGIEQVGVFDHATGN
eukprot:COSAG02_NODE_4005_length_5922_cov_40.612227_5_plen_109_part_00